MGVCVCVCERERERERERKCMCVLVCVTSVSECVGQCACMSEYVVNSVYERGGGGRESVWVCVCAYMHISKLRVFGVFFSRNKFDYRRKNE